MSTITRFLFLVWPFAEILVFALVGYQIGWGWTILLLLAAGVAGVLLLRLSNRATIMSIQSAMVKGRLPENALFDSAFLTIAAFLLILPGFISDMIAIAILIGPLRRMMGLWLSRGASTIEPGFQGRGNPFEHSGGGDIIEGEWKIVEDDEGDGKNVGEGHGSSGPGCEKPASMIAKNPLSPGENDERER